MSGQTVYRNQLRGFAGQRVGSEHAAKTGKNDTGAVRQVDDIVVINVPQAQVNNIEVTSNTDGTYTATINGIDHDFVASSDTVEAIRDGLEAAINAGVQPVTVAPVSTDNMTITADVAGVPFTIAIAAPGGPDLCGEGRLRPPTAPGHPRCPGPHQRPRLQRVRAGTTHRRR